MAVNAHVMNSGMSGLAWRVLACALGAAAASAWSAEPADTNRGRLLYENHCVVCHTAKVHRRIPPLAIDRSELRLIVSAWAGEAKTNWGPSEIEDVVNYLDATYYRMPR